MVKDDNIIALLERITGATRHKEIDEQKRLDATIARITGSSQTIADYYQTAPQPGHGPGRYTPQARATGRDMVSLFVPDTAFDGTWVDFRRARDEAIAWLRANRYAVVDSQKLCWGPAFDLDDSTLSYRDSSGTAWYNAAIEREQDFQLARIKSRT